MADSLHVRTAKLSLDFFVSSDNCPRRGGWRFGLGSKSKLVHDLMCTALDACAICLLLFKTAIDCMESFERAYRLPCGVLF